LQAHSKSSIEAPVPYKELAVDEDALLRRGREKKGNPRKLPKALRRRSRQLKRF
jgi:hypothetical protein